MTTFALLLVLAALVSVLCVIGWRRVLSADRPLLFGHMLLRQGARLPELTSLTGRELGRAVRRCSVCSSQQRCSAWLEQEHPHESYESFCPNAGFIEQVKALRPLIPRADSQRWIHQRLSRTWAMRRAARAAPSVSTGL